MTTKLSLHVRRVVEVGGDDTVDWLVVALGLAGAMLVERGGEAR